MFELLSFCFHHHFSLSSPKLFDLFIEFSFQILDFLHHFIQLYNCIFLDIITQAFIANFFKFIELFICDLFQFLEFLDDIYDCSFEFWSPSRQFSLKNIYIGLADLGEIRCLGLFFCLWVLQ